MNLTLVFWPKGLVYPWVRKEERLQFPTKTDSLKTGLGILKTFIEDSGLWSGRADLSKGANSK